MQNSDVLIIGCGIAGAAAALELSKNPERKITILTREDDPQESNTRYAQGGIIGRGVEDSAEILAKDILAAGAGAASPEAARILSEEGPKILQKVLVETAGIQFDTRSDGGPEYGIEAAHSCRRILHVGDGTGQAIITGLLKTIHERPNITILSDSTAVDLITFPHHSRDPLKSYQAVSCHGAYAFNRKERTVHRYFSAATILATGGIGRIYMNTPTLPERAEMAWLWHTARERALRTPNTCNFTPPRWPPPVRKDF
jgi:L-aspartate oxidase